MNQCGSDTTEIELEIQGPIPGVDFHSNVWQLCLNDNVQFSDQTSETPNSWSWTFEGGIPAVSTEQNPLVIYNTPGKYSVTLEASNIYGTATLERTEYVEVKDVPKADFNTISIVDFTVDFESTSLFTDNVIWDFGDGNSSTENAPFHTYLEHGEYEVILIAMNPCGADTITKTVNIEVSGNFEIGNFEKIDLFPNPNDGQFNLIVNGKPDKEIILEVVNLLGQKIWSEVYDFSTGRLKKAIEIPADSGVFLLRIRSSNGKEVFRKIIVER